MCMQAESQAPARLDQPAEDTDLLHPESQVRPANPALLNVERLYIG